MPEPTASDARRLRDLLSSLLIESAAFVNSSSVEPMPGSTAAIEMDSFPNSESVRAAYAQGSTLIEVVADHAFAVVDILSGKVQTVAPFTCVRAALEAAAIGAWLLANDIDVRERVSRSIAFQYEGAKQQAKAAVSIGQDPGPSKASLTEIVDRGKGLGYKPITKRKKIIGIGQVMPNATDLVRDVLSEEGSYRILSSIVHGHTSMVGQVSFRPLAEDSNYREKHLKPQNAAYLIVLAAECFKRPVLRKAALYGHDVSALFGIMRNIRNQMATLWPQS